MPVFLQASVLAPRWRSLSGRTSSSICGCPTLRSAESSLKSKPSSTTTALISSLWVCASWTATQPMATKTKPYTYFTIVLLLRCAWTWSRLNTCAALPLSARDTARSWELGPSRLDPFRSSSFPWRKENIPSKSRRLSKTRRSMMESGKCCGWW